MNKTKGIRKVLRILFQSACLLVFLYLLTVFAYRCAVADAGSKTSAVARFLMELIVCCFFAMLAADIYRRIFTWKRNKFTRVLGWILRGIVILVCGVYIILMTVISHPKLEDTTEDVDYVLVLGLALENGRAAGDLVRRVEQAIIFEKDYPDADIIFTGGTHDDLVQTEAVIMVQYFVDHGGDMNHALEETHSQDTVQNFKNVGEMTGNNVPVAVVTSDYHMFRVAAIMRCQGWNLVRYVPAPSDPVLYGENLLWEAVCVIVGAAQGTLSLW